MKGVRSWLFFLSLAFTVLATLFGCRKADEKKTEEERNNIITVQDLTRIEEKESKILSHDFGVIHYPVEDQKCEFEITNSSTSTWHLERIINSCSCAVADISTPKIKPGETAKVLVAYTPRGEGSYDDQRKSLIVFQEKNAPTFTLLVSSQVREDMTVRPVSLSWNQMGKGQTRKDYFEIQNFSKENWDEVEIVSCPEWLSYELKEVQVPPETESMKQLYSVSLLVQTDQLDELEYKSSIEIEARTADQEQFHKSIPVSLKLTAAVSLIPEQLFFGGIVPGEESVITVKVNFAPDSIPADTSQITFEHNLGESLKFQWLSTEGDMWELQAILNMPETDLPDNPQVVVNFNDDVLPTLSLPVYAMRTERSTE